MIPNVCIRGSKEHAATVIKFLESLGGRNLGRYNGRYAGDFYYIDSNGVILSTERISRPEITIQQAQDILDGKATLREDGTIEYSKTPKFPRMMWAWDEFSDEVVLVKVHGFISTLNYPWISDIGNYLHASDTDPRIPELTIEEAEAKFNIKIKRQ